MKKNIIFTLFGIMCATGAVTTDSIAACDVCATAGLNVTQTTKGALPWDDTSSANGEYAHQLVFWENCNKHQNETISYYKCDAMNDRKCIFGRATVYSTGAYPALIDDTDDTIEERLICCDAPTNGTAKWTPIQHTNDWTGIPRTGCTEVIAANCPINNNAPIFRAGDYFSSTSCLDTAADTEEQSPTETYTRPANCPASANTCLRNVYTDAKLLFANAQAATAAWAWNARLSYTKRRVMYWKNCGTTCFESYGCQTDQDDTQLNHGKFIYAPLRADNEGAYTYKIIGSNDLDPGEDLADRYELLYCDASQNKWIKLTKAENVDTTEYKQITVDGKTLYVSATDNISARTLWSTEQTAPTQEEIEEEDEDQDEDDENACQSYSTKIHAINSAMDILNKFKYTDDTSVWTTAEGKFNTARLGTDIASGIAMGLTGGLVSNVIIKNKQIKQGIQGYQCTVDSNIIADYGDEFVIDLAY